MALRTPSTDEQMIHQALQRLMWTEQKRFTQLLAEHGLTLPQFIVLATMNKRGTGCPIGALADEIFQSYPTMTGIIDRLEDARLVLRERGSKKDRRMVVVTLTGAGRQILDRAMAARKERMQQALAEFTARDRREFVRLLGTYLSALERET
jgi:DNA-binding MarR family transcriptional regulator